MSSAKHLDELVPTVMWILLSRRAVCLANASLRAWAAYIVNFDGSGGNNTTNRFTWMRRFQRYTIHILVKFDLCCENSDVEPNLAQLSRNWTCFLPGSLAKSRRIGLIISLIDRADQGLSIKPLVAFIRPLGGKIWADSDLMVDCTWMVVWSWREATRVVDRFLKLSFVFTSMRQEYNRNELI